MIALSTAVAVAVSAAPSDADAGEMPRLAISGSDSAVDTSTVSGSDSVTVNPDAAVKLSPISDRTAVTLADNETVEVSNGKLPNADIGSETGAARQVDGSDAVNALVITDGTNVDAINLPVDHTTKTAWHVSDTGRGGKTAHDSTVSATSGDTSARSTPPDSHFTVGSPLTETPSGSGDHSGSLFKPTPEHHATVDPGINLDVIPTDHLPQHLGANLLNIPSQAEHGAGPAHPHVDGNQSASADDGNAHHSALPSDLPVLTALPNDSSGTRGSATPAYAPGEDTSADNGHHLIADPEINVAAHTEHNGDDSPAAVGGAAPPHRQGDESESDDFKFANDGRGSPPADHGRHANSDPETNFPSNAEHSADNSRHTTAQDGDKSSAVIDGAHLTHRQGDENDSAVSKFTNDGKGSPPAGHGHHATAGPETNSPSVAKNHPPQQPEDNSLHTPNQYDDNGSPAASGRAHPSHDQVTSREPASPKLADDGIPPSSHRPGEGTSVQSAPADPSHRGNADPKNNDIANDHPPQRPTDESLHTSAQLDDSGSPAETAGGHLPRGQAEKSEPASAKFADAGSAPPGKVPHDSPTLTALNDVTGDDSAHPFKTNLDHHASADPDISDVAKNLYTPLHPDDNGSPVVADRAHTAPQAGAKQLDSFKFADAGSAHPDTAPNGAHTADPQVDGKHLKLADGVHGAHTADPQTDGNESDSFKFVDGGDLAGTIPNGRPTILSAASSDSSGTTGPAPPTLAQTFDVAEPGMSSAPNQFIFAEKAGHDWVADHKPNVVEADHSLPHDVQQLLEIADQMNSASTPEPHHAIAPQHVANVQTQHHQDASHLA
jgi:hypothetical protein